MSEPITHAMILVTINQGYSDAVMNTARAAGATGGTILKGLRCSPGKSAVIFGITIQEEQEIVAIVVPKDKKTEIMQAISSAHGMVLPFPCQWTELWDCNADEAILLSGITKKNCTLITIINIQFFFQIHISCI